MCFFFFFFFFFFFLSFHVTVRAAASNFLHAVAEVDDKVKESLIAEGLHVAASPICVCWLDVVFISLCRGMKGLCFRCCSQGADAHPSLPTYYVPFASPWYFRSLMTSKSRSLRVIIILFLFAFVFLDWCVIKTEHKCCYIVFSSQSYVTTKQSHGHAMLLTTVTSKHPTASGNPVYYHIITQVVCECGQNYDAAATCFKNSWSSSVLFKYLRLPDRFGHILKYWSCFPASMHTRSKVWVEMTETPPKSRFSFLPRPSISAFWVG